MAAAFGVTVCADVLCFLTRLNGSAFCHCCRAMLCKRGLCPHVLSVCSSRSCILSKRINIFSKCFHYRIAKPLYFVRTKHHGNSSLGTNRDCRLLQCSQQVRPSSVLIPQRRLSHPVAFTTTTKTRQEKTIYLYAAVNLKRNLHSTYCTIEATDRHEASRGLSATAGLGLLVLIYSILLIVQLASLMISTCCRL